MYTELYNEWVKQANLSPLTSKQHKFAEFLLEHHKMIGLIGDMESVFTSVRKFIKTHEIIEK